MGLYDEVKNGNQFTIQGGILANMSLKRSLSELVGRNGWTAKDEEEYQKLLKDAEYRQEQENKKFLEKWGEEVVKLHKWLSEKFGNSYELNYYNSSKKWRLSTWEDNSEQSEGFELLWDRGFYSILFNSGDGYDKPIIVKPNVSEEYIYNCIENWT